MYENVLREDLAKELFNLRDCRQTMAKEAIAQVCQKPAATSAAPCNIKVVQRSKGDGNSLRAQSQIGAFTAQRDTSCSLL